MLKSIFYTQIVKFVIQQRKTLKKNHLNLKNV